MESLLGCVCTNTDRVSSKPFSVEKMTLGVTGKPVVIVASRRYFDTSFSNSISAYRRLQKLRRNVDEMRK